MLFERHKAGYVFKWNIHSGQSEIQMFSKTFIGVWDMKVAIQVKKYSVTCFSNWPLDDCPFEGHSKLLMPERPFSFFPIFLSLLAVPRISSHYLCYLVCCFIFLFYQLFPLLSITRQSPYITVLSGITVHATVQAVICWTLSEDQFWSWYGMHRIRCRAISSGKDFSPNTSVYPCQHHPINASYSVILLSPAVWS